MKNKHKAFDEYLEDRFMELGEVGGVPITKDNCEDMLSDWLSQLDVGELIDFADEYGSIEHMNGQIVGLANAEINKDK